MAELIAIKPKPMTLKELNEMISRQEMLESTTPKVMYKSGPAGLMTRPCKLFVKVASDGLLMDTSTVSDVVNFECYESIASSAVRALAEYIKGDPERIEVTDLFYYKKRARSNRMNPVKIKNTTDVFRAVAEHPTGEVPIGVRWMLKTTISHVTGTEKATHSKEDTSDTVDQAVSSLSDIPEKRRRTTKLYWSVHPITQVDTEEKNTPRHYDTRSHDFPTPKKAFLKKTEKGTQITSDSGTPPPPEDKHWAFSSNHQATYLWPEDATTELVISYGGLVEKRKLSPALAFIIRMFTKGDYSCVTKETQAMFKLGEVNETKKGVPQPPPVIKLPPCVHDMEPDKKEPITFLKSAKSEIFKILSMVNVSRSRFKKLLHWMKGLRLEDGKQGKYYLTERNPVGGTTITYHTDPETARKAGVKPKSAPAPPQVLHPINPNLDWADSNRSSPQVAVGQTPALPGLSNQILLVMPNQASEHGGLVTATQVSGPPGLVTPHSAGMVAMATSQTVSSSSTSSTSSAAMLSGTSVNPRILRKRKVLEASPFSREDSPNPVPMKLYQLYGSTNQVPLVKDFSERTEIKQEVEEFEDEGTDDTTEDFDPVVARGKSSEMLGPGIYTDNPERYPYCEGVLKEDAPLTPQNTQPDYDSVVVKSEPLDDYE